ncbi:hypothetical protein ACUJ8H_43160 [Streptomyces sp. EKR5.2]|uniref:hypothetical protein n=1 Tax=Streptomyces sp. EKR5.2 TaxID=3461014 RepID=UPI0040434CA7
MRPYTRPNRRTYPKAERSRRQIRRATHLEACTVCRHSMRRHALADGQRVCTRGRDEPISCRDCAETCARTPAVYAMGERLASWRPGRWR